MEKSEKTDDHLWCTFCYDLNECLKRLELVQFFSTVQDFEKNTQSLKLILSMQIILTIFGYL